MKRDTMSQGERYMVVDIETAGLEFEDREIVKYQIEKNIVPALHPFFSKIIAIGVKENGEKPVIIHGDDEDKMLADFWALVKNQPMTKIITFNGYGFDIPFLNVRSVLNNIKPETSINLNKWSMARSNHFDVMQALSQTSNFAWISLEMTARILGIPVPDDQTRGPDMAIFYKEGNWEEIVKHNTYDLELTEAIYLKIKDAF